MARRNSDPHFQDRDKAERAQPLLVLDYCFIRNSADEDLLTLLVGKLYPFRKVFAVPVNMKGNDNATINRLVDFIREAGVVQYTYRCDQESNPL